MIVRAPDIIILCDLSQALFDLLQTMNDMTGLLNLLDNGNSAAVITKMSKIDISDD